MPKSIIKLTLSLILLSFLIIPLAANAVNVGDVINDLDRTAGAAKINKTETIFGITGRLINLVLSFLGAIFLLLIIYGGITWMTAMGNEEKVKKAASIISHATIGVIIIISAFLLTNFVIFKLAGTTPGEPAGSSELAQPSIESFIATVKNIKNSSYQLNWKVKDAISVKIIDNDEQIIVPEGALISYHIVFLTEPGTYTYTLTAYGEQGKTPATKDVVIEVIEPLSCSANDFQLPQTPPRACGSFPPAAGNLTCCGAVCGNGWNCKDIGSCQNAVIIQGNWDNCTPENLCVQNLCPRGQDFVCCQ